VLRSDPNPGSGTSFEPLPGSYPLHGTPSPASITMGSPRSVSYLQTYEVTAANARDRDSRHHPVRLVCGIIFLAASFVAYEMKLEARVGFELRSPTDSTQVTDFPWRYNRQDRYRRPSWVQFRYT
jgi:hypothetical protein